jgi:hypothetical protein
LGTHTKKRAKLCLYISIFIFFYSFLEFKDSAPINGKNSLISISVEFFKNGILIYGQNGVIINILFLVRLKGGKKNCHLETLGELCDPSQFVAGIYVRNLVHTLLFSLRVKRWGYGVVTEGLTELI